MNTELAGLKLFIGLVSFERDTDSHEFLPQEAEGAVGWMGGKAKTERQFEELLRDEMAQIGLRFIEVEYVEQIFNFSDALPHDEHLVHNMEHWEAGRMTVWGTIHIYLGEGEA